MSWYALESVEEAVDNTKEFLFPIKWVLWTKIALIAIFLGNIGSIPTMPTTGDDFSGVGSGGDYASINAPETPQIANSEKPLGLETNHVVESFDQTIFASDVNLIFLALIAAVFGIAFLYISAVFEFIFYQSLMDEKIKVIEDFGNHAINGAKYLAIFLGVLAVLGASGYVALFSFEYSQVLGFFVVLALLPVWLTAFLLLFFTQNMLIPEVIKTGKGFIEGYRSIFGYLRSEWKQAGLFLIGKIIVDIVATIIVLIAAIFILLVLLIPAGLLAVLMFLIHPILVIFVVILAVLALLILYLYLQVPVQTFIYQYVLSVYRRFAE